MEENRKLPRNIRQIGERDSLYRIYIEDYVDTFCINWKAKEQQKQVSFWERQ